MCIEAQEIIIKVMFVTLRALAMIMIIVAVMINESDPRCVADATVHLCNGRCVCVCVCFAVKLRDSNVNK